MSALFPAIAGNELREIVGRGGEATIYEAMDERHGRNVAVKVLDGQSFDDGQRRAFTRELRAMGRLGDHPHVVNVFDSGFTEAGRPFLVMPLLSKGTLSARVSGLGPLQVDELLQLGIKIGSALETAHRRGILHCDIKPNNLLIGPWDEPMLADFGISSITNIGLTSTNRVSLTVMYAAPEILLDDGSPTVASDIYSLGASFYTLASGEAAYRGNTPVAVMKNLLASSEVPRLSDSVPSELADVIAEMMDHDPLKRPKSAARVVARLQQMQQDLGVAPTSAIIGDALKERSAGGAPATSPDEDSTTGAPATLPDEGPTIGAAPTVADDGAPDPLAENQPMPTHARSSPAASGVLTGATSSRARVPGARAVAVFAAVLLAIGAFIFIATRDTSSTEVAGVSATPAVETAVSGALDADTADADSADADAEPDTASADAERDAEAADADTATAVPAVVVPTVAPTPAPQTPTAVPPALGETGDAGDLEVAFASAAAPAPIEPAVVPPPADPATFGLLERPIDSRSQPNGAHFGTIVTTAWSVSGLIATGGEDQSVRIWDEQGTLIADFTHESRVADVAWSPDGARLAIATSTEVTIWDMVTASSTTLDTSPGVSYLDWSTDGTRLGGGAWRRILMWDAASGEAIYIADSNTGNSDSIDLADDGRVIVTTQNGYLLEWDTTVLADPSVIAVFPESAYDTAVGYLDPSEPGGTVFVGMPGQPILFFDSVDKTVLRSLTDYHHPVQIQISPDGTQMLSLGQTAQLRLWDFASGEIVADFVPGFPNAFDVAWSPSGEEFVTVGNAGKGYIYNIADLDRLETIELQVPPVE